MSFVIRTAPKVNFVYTKSLFLKYKIKKTRRAGTWSGGERSVNVWTHQKLTTYEFLQDSLFFLESVMHVEMRLVSHYEVGHKWYCGT